MASAIDITKPIYGAPTTQSVRDNFSAASNEIGALQIDVANRVRKDGDTMLDFLTLNADPTLAMHAANRAWVINQVRSTINAMIYVGDYNAATDMVLTSGQASVPINLPLPVAGPSNNQMFLTVKVGKAAPSIGNQPPGGVPVGSWLISNGTSWNVYQPSAAGVTAQTVPVNPAIAGLPGADVYAALNSVPAMYLPKTGGILTGDLTAPNYIINTAPTLANHAATKAYVDNLSSSVVVSDTPPGAPKPGSLWWDSVAGQLNISYQDVDTQQWVIANSSSGWVDAPADGLTYARKSSTWTSVDAMVLPANNNAGRNLIHNPLFNIWQRGIGPFTSSVYHADRWASYSNIGTMSLTRVALSDADRTAIGDETARFAIQYTFTGGATTGASTQLYQHSEDARRLSGKTVTASFWAWGSAIKLGVRGEQKFGSGGSPSADIYGSMQIVTLSATPTRYSITFTFPSTAGKTFGTNDNSISTLDFYLSNLGETSVGVQSGTVYFWGIQLEVGTVMTPLDKPDPAQDLIKCMRYYQVGSIGLSASGVAGSGMQVISTLAAPMRPGMIFTLNGQVTSNCSNLTLGNWGPSQNVIVCNVSSVTATGIVNFNTNYTASSDL